MKYRMMNGIQDLSFGPKSISKAKVSPTQTDRADGRFIITSLLDRAKEGIRDLTTWCKAPHFENLTRTDDRQTTIRKLLTLLKSISNRISQLSIHSICHLYILIRSEGGLLLVKERGVLLGKLLVGLHISERGGGLSRR
jgi:hypothetical protein